MRRFAKSLGWCLAFSLGLVLAACGSTPTVIAGGQQVRTITVNASSEVTVVPDKADFYVEVQVEGETAKEAQDAAKGPVNAIMKALRIAGVKDKNIQTNYTNVNPVYDWSTTESGEPKIVRYESITSLRVSGVDVDDVSNFMDICLAAGATGVNGPVYSTASYEEAYQQALSEAVAASREKASVLAKAAGVSLGKVVSITEGYENTAYRYEEKALTADSGSGGSDELDIAPGEVTIEAQVTVSYSIG